MPLEIKTLNIKSTVVVNNEPTGQQFSDDEWEAERKKIVRECMEKLRTETKTVQHMR